jgi:nucleotide-binding universal stress UspA family protein
MPDNQPTVETILVATDGSRPAQIAAQTAVQIAQGQQFLVRGLYVVDESLIFDTYADYQAELGALDDESITRADLATLLEGQGERALDRLENQCQAAGLWVTTEMVGGGVPELVGQAAEEVRLLALGRRGRGHTDAPDYLGRNFRAIAHHTETPLLAGGDEAGSIERVLLAYDSSEHAQAALDWVSLLQRTLKAEPVVLAVQEHAADPTEQWLEDAGSRLAAGGVTGQRLMMRSGRAADEIVTAAAEAQVDLIVMGCYHHAALVEWLTGSTADEVLRRTPLPVLIA